MKILRLVLNITETSGAYYLFALPLRKKINQIMLSYFKPKVKNNKGLKIINSNRSIIYFFRALLKIYKKREIQIIHAHSPHVGFLTVLVDVFFRKKNKLPKLFSVHYSFDHLNIRNQIILLPIFILFDKIIFCSNASLNSFPKIYRALVKNKYNVIYNGIMEPRGIFRSEDNKTDIKKFNIIVVSRLEKFKNIDLIIDSILSLKDKNIFLKVIGDGSFRSFLESKIKNYKYKKNFDFTGEISRQEVYHNLINSDLYISMSSSEGFPVSVLESLINKCPVVLSNIEPHLDLARENKIIKIINLRDLGSLTDIILKYKKMKKNELQYLRQKSKEFVQKNYSHSSMIANYLNEYELLLYT